MNMKKIIDTDIYSIYSIVKNKSWFVLLQQRIQLVSSISHAVRTARTVAGQG